MKKFYFTVIFIVYHLFALAQTPTGNSTEVGITEGQLSVSLTGGASYSIPIAVPAGINGVVPQISLNYNSQSGNGIAGYGWNISGVSSITRIPATKFHDGTIDGVDFNSLDRFAFDGQRLMVKNGTSGVYGANATTYETESFSNVKITSYGVHPSGANYGPAYFIVEYPDGSKAFYGNSTDSRSITDWAITYWENPQGVRISYNYILNNNNLSIEYIKYGSTTTNAPINQIKFIYLPRQRPEQAYVGGQSLLRNTILSEINVSGNGVGFRNYILAQDLTSLGYERLKSITEKSGDNTKSYNPTIFSYENTAESISYSNLISDLSVGNISSQNAATVSGDFDGDGKMDFLLYPTTGTDSKSKYWFFSGISPGTSNVGVEHAVGKFDDIFPVSWLNDSNKLMPMQGWNVVKTDATTNMTTFNTYSTWCSTYSFCEQYVKQYTFPKLIYYSEHPLSCIQTRPPIKNVENIPKSYISGDFNGDGLTDIVAIERNFSYSYLGPCDSNDEPVNVTKTYTGDAYFVNLDRRISSNYVNIAGKMNLVSTSKLMVADFNGDGKSDVYVFDTGKVKIYSLNDSNQFVLLFQTVTTDTNISLDKPILMGDYNGDGKSDFIIPKGGSNNYAKYISTGISFIKSDVTYDIPYKNNYISSDFVEINNIIPTDINGDGKTDLISYTTSGRYSTNSAGYIIGIWKNMDSNFVNAVTKNTGLISGVKPYAMPIFLSSDKPNFGLELAAISDNKIHHFKSEKDFNRESLLDTITTGNGVTESITYKPLQQDPYENIYTPSSYIENYPNIDIVVAPGFQVVSQLEKQSAAVYKKQLFSYYGAVSNVEGLGFLGFRGTMRTNWYDDTITPISSISKNDINLRGANIENYSVLNLASPSSNTTPSNFISKSLLTYESELLPNKVFKIKNTISQQFNGLDDTNSETTNTYDIYNSPTQSTTKIKEGTTIVKTTTGTVIYDNQPAGATYYVGRPTSKTQSVISSGDTMNSEELYAYTNHLLTQVKKKGHNTDYITEDNLYDPFGNITKKTISVPGLTSRVTNYEYDSSKRFLTKSIDIEGLETTFVYNNNNGLLNSETNPYSLTTSYSYDPWFKKTKTTDYLGKSNSYTYTRSSEKTIVTSIGDDGSGSQEVFDDLGRKMTAGVKDINGNFTTVSYLYDIYDRNIKTSEPYLGTSPSQWNEAQYDVYGRPTQSISFTGKTVTMGYSGLTTTVNDGTKTKTSTKNAIGNVVSMTDTPGGTINYTYFANGNLKTSNYEGVVTTIEQDGWGRKTKLTDPSAGTYLYEYNLFGETTKETTPNGTTNYTLNNVGKLTAKSIVGNPTSLTNSNTSYVYDGTTKLLTATTFTNTLEGGAVTTNAYEYDGFKRLFKTTETTPYATFIKQLTFDAFGRTDKETSTAVAGGKTSAKTIKNTYKNGYPWQIVDDATSQPLWQTNTTNARGQLATAAMGNGNIAITNTYDTYGFATQIKHDRVGISPGNVMTLNTVFDPQKGNLTSRTNSLFNWNESFLYDSLDRLTTFTNALGLQETQNYDDRGRITKNAVGDYNYTTTAKPYQNTSVTVTPAAKTYYEARQTQNITYNTFKSPVQIEEVGIDKISFTYNDGNDRSSMFYGGLQDDKLQRQYRKHYSADGSMEIKQNTTTGAVEFVTYIGGDGYSAPIVLKSDGTTQNYLYLHRDYQGSILAITNSVGQVVEKRLFDAWGTIVKVQDGAGNTLNGLTILDRGYTGHEHLQSVGIIHMNGRLYDPKLHRFLQPDNYVQDPSNTQNYNRYGYCWNNPLKYTDPSGEFTWSDLFASVSIVAGAALAVFGGPAGAALGVKLIAAGVSHFVATAVILLNNGGSWDKASNYVGFQSPTININPGWGDSKSDKNGVIQEQPVVKPKSDTKSEGNGDGKDKQYDSWFFENQYFDNEGSLRVGTYLDFSPVKRLFGITLGEYRESGYTANYYNYAGSITKNHMNHYFEAGFAVGGGMNYKYNLGENRFESFSLSLFGFSAEYSKQSSYQSQFYIGLDTGFSLGIGVGGSEKIKGGWRWKL